MARTARAVGVSMSRSKPSASRRSRPGQAKVRSITHRRAGPPAEALGVARALDDVERQSLARGGAPGAVAPVASSIGERMPRPGAAPSHPGAGQLEAAVAVLDVGRVGHQPERQPQRVGEQQMQMPLAPVNLLARIEAARAAGLGRLDALLAVDDPGRRRRPTAGLSPGRHEQGHPDRRPNPFPPGAAGMVVDRASRRGVSLGSTRHGQQPVRSRHSGAFDTARDKVVRRRPPCLAGGRKGAIGADPASVTSVAQRSPERRCRWRAGAVHVGRDPSFLAEQGHHHPLMPLTVFSDGL
jgi:hypothetical protein